MKEKSEKKRLGMIFFILLIMVGMSFSLFSGFSGNAEKAKYNDIKFTRFPDRWEAKISGKEAAFSFLPNDVENIPVSGDFASLLQSKPEVDVTYDVNSTYNQSIALAQYQMGLTLEAYNIYVRQGFTSNNTFKTQIIKCKDATQNVPVVYFRYANATRINVNGSCVIAEASSNSDFIRAKDRLLYGILGVVK